MLGFMKGSGLRSEGGIWSGLEGADAVLLVFLFRSELILLPIVSEPDASV